MSSRWLTPNIITCHCPVASPGTQGSRWAHAVPQPWTLQPSSLALCASQPKRLHRGVFRCLSTSSPLVWRIGSSVTCQWPAGPHQSCCYLFICCFFSFLSSPCSNSALLWHPLCMEHSIFSIFLVFQYSMKCILSFTMDGAVGSAHMSAEILHYSWL